MWSICWFNGCIFFKLNVEYSYEEWYIYDSVIECGMYMLYEVVDRNWVILMCVESCDF